MRFIGICFLLLSLSSSSSSSSLNVATDQDDTASLTLYRRACSILEGITSHAPPSNSASYSYPPSILIPSPSTSNSMSVSASTTSTQLLDWLEGSLGPIGSNSIRYLRKFIPSSTPATSTIDWSLRGTTKRVLDGLKATLLNHGDKNTQSQSHSRAGKNSRGKESLQDRFKKWEQTGIMPGPGLSMDEVKTGMEIMLNLLKESAAKGNSEANLLLGNLYLTGHLSLEPSPELALTYFTKASEEAGLPEAQYKLGFLYGSNFGSSIPGNQQNQEGVGKQGSALLHYTFAALSNHVPASMTIGYRHWVGIGTKQSCKDSLGWYKVAADAAMKAFNAGPPGGRHLPPPKIRLSDLLGGPYGPGASSSHRPHITGGSNSQTQQEWDDLLEFHLFHAERLDSTNMFRLGRLFYQGFGGSGGGGERRSGAGKGSKKSRLLVARDSLEDGLSEGGRDFGKAFRWFLGVCRLVWKSDGRDAMANPKDKEGKTLKGRIGYYDSTKDVKNKIDDHGVMVAGLAAGYLGRMYLRGEGVRVDYAKAFLWFKRGSGQSDRESNNGLGIMYRDGLGVARDVKKANMLFLAAAQQDLAEAQVNLGKFHFGIGDFALATTYFEHAIRFDGVRQPDTFQAYYYLAELQSRALNRNDQCPNAVAFYKVVAERGDWEHEVWWEAERAWVNGDKRTAVLGYWIMAERGYEVAQNNLAWILDPDKKRYSIPVIDSTPTSNLTDRLALAYWTRSAAQDNVDALVKMGDYYFTGLGTDDGIPQLERAAACYQSAVTSRISAMAMWNLGWMHENGKGVAKDFHLAKRYYDMALETSLDAYLPATLSLISLYARSAYNAILGADDDLKSLSLFARPPLTEDPERAQLNTPPPPGGSVQPWSFNRAWREIQRRWGLDPGPQALGAAEAAEGEVAPGGGQRTDAARELELAEAQRALEGNGDQGEWGRRGREGGMDEEDDDEFWILEGDGDFTGTVAIVLLCGILGWLLYFRQGRAVEGRQPAPPGVVAQDPGIVPEEGDGELDEQ